MKFFLYIPLRDDWGVVHHHRIRTYKKYKTARKALEAFDSGHLTNDKDRFVFIKQNRKILFEA